MKAGDQKDEHLDDDTSGIILNQRLNLEDNWKIILSNMVSERKNTFVGYILQTKSQNIARGTTDPWVDTMG